MRPQQIEFGAVLGRNPRPGSIVKPRVRCCTFVAVDDADEGTAGGRHLAHSGRRLGIRVGEGTAPWSVWN
jgi:hypothetical protein